MEVRLGTSAAGMETITVYGSAPSGPTLGSYNIGSFGTGGYYYDPTGHSFYNNLYALVPVMVDYAAIIEQYYEARPDLEPDDIEEITVTGQRWMLDPNSTFDTQDFLAKVAAAAAAARAAGGGTRGALVAAIFAALDYLYDNVPVRLEPTVDPDATPLTQDQIDALIEYYQNNGGWPVIQY